ncbi:MAG: transporter substrate-binding domain-containing protein, partial [Deltaproteobacteria bacterium]
MARPSILRALCTAVAALAVSASVAHAASTLERIRDRHSIVFAYRDGAAPFSFRDRDGHVRGYSVELCSRVAAAIRERLRLSDFAVEWVPVDAATRLDAVAAGRVDAECGTTTITLSRMERVDFSVPIFVDGGALAVALRSPVRRVADLGGRRVAVIPGTTTERALRAALDLTGVKATIVSVARPEEGAAMVRR